MEHPREAQNAISLALRGSLDGRHGATCAAAPTWLAVPYRWNAKNIHKMGIVTESNFVELELIFVILN